MKEKTKTKSNSRALEIRPAGPLDAKHGLDRMIEKVIDSKAPVENLERLLALKEKYEARESEKAFHEAFCKMQGEFPMIRRTHEVKDGARTAYRYAALEDIIRQIQPVLAKHGFAYSWYEEMDAAAKVKRVYCKISGYGHSETSHVVIPIMDPKGFTNAAQQHGSSSTYGKRYSLIGILGIQCEDDDDGRGAIPENVQPSSRIPKNAKPVEVVQFADQAMSPDERTSILNSIVKKAKAMNWDEQDLRDFLRVGWKVRMLKELTDDQALAVEQALDAKMNEAPRGK